MSSKTRKITPKGIPTNYIVLLMLVAGTFVHGGQEKPIGIQEVQLKDAFWSPKIERIQEKTISFALLKCREEGRFDNFLVAGGVKEGEYRGVMPFDDTDVYKIIEGASYTLQTSPNPELAAELDKMIAIIAHGQETDGYLTTWRTIDSSKSPASWVEAGERWHHLAASHELYNAGHLFEAATAHYRATGKTNFLEIAEKYADLIVKTFGPGKIETVPGHQIIETGLIKLYKISKNEDYLNLAKYFLDERGHANGRELFGPYSQDHLPVIDQDEVVGHAVRAVYMYAGMTDIAEIFDDQAYKQAVNNLWQNMVGKKLYITGGIGARHEGEAFGENYELPNKTAYAETCAAIGSVIWNQRLFLMSGNSKHYDIIERTLYNGLISGISEDGIHFFYPNCLEADKTFEFNRGNHTRAEWFDCSCCPTNLIRFLPTLPELIYTKSASNTLSVNLFIGSQAQTLINGSEIKMTQQSNYPWNGNIQFKIEATNATDFTLKLRIPSWAMNKPVPGNLYQYQTEKDLPISLKIEGKDQEFTIEEGYIHIRRNWARNTTLELELPMPVRMVKANDRVENLSGKTAIERGPLVYCFEEHDNEIDPFELTLSESPLFQTQDEELLNGITAITTLDTASGQQATAIPYYSWSNRGESKMRTWIPPQTKSN